MELDVNYQDLTIIAFEHLAWTDVVQVYELVMEERPDAPRLSTLSELDRKILLDTIRSEYEHNDYPSLHDSVKPGIEAYLEWWHSVQTHEEGEDCEA